MNSPVTIVTESLRDGRTAYDVEFSTASGTYVVELSTTNHAKAVELKTLLEKYIAWAQIRPTR